jgi:hypothetical protein
MSENRITKAQDLKEEAAWRRANGKRLRRIWDEAQLELHRAEIARLEKKLARA